MSRALLALLLAAVPILSAGQSDEPIRRPEIRAGDSWTYRGTNIFEPGTHEYETRVTYADDKIILLISKRKGDGKEIDSSWTSEWNAVTSHTGRMYRPNTGVFRFPLRIGDKHESTYEYLQPRVNIVLGKTTETAKVVGWDTVDVPAGQFRAIKVTTEAVVRPVDGSKPYEVQGAFWYVPEIRRWVKLQVAVVGTKITFGEELLAYKLNED